MVVYALDVSRIPHFFFNLCEWMEVWPEHDGSSSPPPPHPKRSNSSFVTTSTSMSAMIRSKESCFLRALLLLAMLCGGTARASSAPSNWRELQNNRTYAMERVAANPRSFKLLTAEFRDDREIVEYAVRKSGSNLQFAEDRWRKNVDIVLLAIATDASAIRFAAPSLRDNRTFILGAATINGAVLNKLRNTPWLKDRSIVLAAVGSYGHALEQLKRFQDDEEIVRAAATQNGFALQYASPRLKRQLEVCLVAYRQNRDALKHCDKSIREATEREFARRNASPRSREEL